MPLPDLSPEQRAAALEKAAADRHLFVGAPRSDFVELRTSEYAISLLS